MTAAISAARAGAKVTLLEQNKQVGKKLLVTGNGRCNLTNRDQALSHYRGSSPASAVADALRMEAEHQKVKLALNTRVQKIRKEKGRFFAETFGWTYEGDALILAAGSCAAAQTGSDGSGYVFAETMGHSLIKPLPALVQLRSKDPIFPKLKGLRTEAKVTLFSEKEPLAEDTGEVQFTEYGLSGIPVFQVSRYGVNREKIFGQF